MFIRITNDIGAISIDENIIFDVINEVIRSFPKNALKLGKDNKTNRIISMHEDGVFVHVEYIVKFGTSISEVSKRTIDSLYSLLKDQLELDVSNIEVSIIGVQTNKGTLERDILYDFKNDGLVYWNE